MIKLILATDKNGALGYKGKLPWECKEDLELFRTKTTGTHVVMGRKTCDSLPFSTGLPYRTNWVVSRNKEYEYPGVPVVAPEEILTVEAMNKDVVFWIIGGKSMYEFFAPYADEIHHTIIEGTYEADVFIDLEPLLKDFSLCQSSKIDGIMVTNKYQRR